MLAFICEMYGIVDMTSCATDTRSYHEIIHVVNVFWSELRQKYQDAEWKSCPDKILRLWRALGKKKKHCVILHSRHRKLNDYQINWSYCLGRAATIHTSLTCSIAAVFKLTPRICLIQVAFVVRARIPLACYRVYSDRVRHTRALRQGDVRVGKKAGRGCMCDRVWPWRALDAAMAPGVRECLLGMSGPAAAWRDHVYLPPRSLSLQELVMM